jgi:hypothetical protein
MTRMLCVLALVLGIGSLSLVVGCEQPKKPDAPAPNTTG